MCECSGSEGEGAEPPRLACQLPVKTLPSSLAPNERQSSGDERQHRASLTVHGEAALLCRFVHADGVGSVRVHHLYGFRAPALASSFPANCDQKRHSGIDTACDGVVG
jgi:hypothetical protein